MFRLAKAGVGRAPWWLICEYPVEEEGAVSPTDAKRDEERIEVDPTKCALNAERICVNGGPRFLEYILNIDDDMTHLAAVRKGHVGILGPEE